MTAFRLTSHTDDTAPTEATPIALHYNVTTLTGDRRKALALALRIAARGDDELARRLNEPVLRFEDM